MPVTDRTAPPLLQHVEEALSHTWRKNKMAGNKQEASDGAGSHESHRTAVRSATENTVQYEWAVPAALHAHGYMYRSVTFYSEG